jgi:hypothetical protein
MPNDHSGARIRLAAALLVASSACGSSSGSAKDVTLDVKQWRDDLRVLASELPTRHANAFHSVTRASFDSAVAALDSALPHLDSDAREVGFRRLVALIGDGHTSLSTSSDARRLPLRFRWFGDPVRAPGALELRLTDAAPPYDHLLGARVLRVGDSSAAGAYQALTAIIADGETVGSRRAASTYFLRRPDLLHGLDVSRTRDSIRFELSDDGGRVRDVWVQPSLPGTRPPWRSAAIREPLYLSRPDDPFWFTRLADARGDSSTVYLAFGGYPGWFDFWRRSRRLMKYLDQHRAWRLVIDLRDNAGGDFNEGRRLLIPGLRNRPAVSSPGHLYVLTGPVTFSAAMTNAVDLRRELGAILVGEPTGARPNQYQEGDSFTLPHSGWRVSVATRYYRFQARDTPGVLPDHDAAQTWDDYRAGRDPALEWILAQPLRP